ncbi:hypothetical protein GWK47_036862 [Chionoecetes opilio]|uniref:Uncharacterized protein n=1 Tax=Chionoecetes opilio TaxID=41210 RepID=A0A8J5CMV8_CHIOP|nr:hypothetical protein GWK47_036862 [Chionoecetes opilio]
MISRLLFKVKELGQVLDTLEGRSPDEDEEDIFFLALISPGPTGREGTNSTRLSNKMRKELGELVFREAEEQVAGAGHVSRPFPCRLGRCECYVQHGHSQLYSCGETVLPGVGHHQGQKSESDH